MNMLLQVFASFSKIVFASKMWSSFGLLDMKERRLIWWNVGLELLKMLIVVYESQKILCSSLICSKVVLDRSNY